MTLKLQHPGPSGCERSYSCAGDFQPAKVWDHLAVLGQAYAVEGVPTDAVDEASAGAVVDRPAASGAVFKL